MKSGTLLKPVVLFIHGFGSSAKCWNPFLKLLREDARITERYELECWDYPTKWIEVNVLGRIPRLEEIARALDNKLDSPSYHDRDVTLVGHSQGGLVIQAYLARVLERSEGPKLRHLRQVIFLATPCAGSKTAMSLRLLFSSFFENPQEITLRVLNPDIADIREVVRERVVSATEESAKQWRVPIHAFCGLQDNIVPEASARGVFDSVKSVPGTHFSILQPKDTADDRYQEFVEVLLDPGGHSHCFEVERYENIIKIEPRDPPATVMTTRRNQPREMQFDNYATLTRRVRFANANRCEKPFKIGYATREDGYVVGHTCQPDELTTPDVRGRNEETGDGHCFSFRPEPRKEYWVTVEVYNGFPPQARNVHFHPGNYDARLRVLSYELDLSAYLEAGYVFSEEPECHFQPRDVAHSALCGLREGGRALPPLSVEGGVYRWELYEIEDGVVDIAWNFRERTAH